MKFEEILSKLSGLDSSYTLNSSNSATLNGDQYMQGGRATLHRFQDDLASASVKDEGRQKTQQIMHQVQSQPVQQQQQQQPQGYQRYYLPSMYSQNGYATAPLIPRYPYPPHWNQCVYGNMSGANIAPFTLSQTLQMNVAKSGTRKRTNSINKVSSNSIVSSAKISQLTRPPIQLLDFHQDETKTESQLSYSKPNDQTTSVKQSSVTNVSQLTNQLINLKVADDNKVDSVQTEGSASLPKGDLAVPFPVIACDETSMAKCDDAMKNQRKSSKPVKESIGGDENTRRGTNLFNRPLKPDKEVDDVTLSAILSTFRRDLLQTTQPISDIVRKYSYKTCCALLAVIVEYFGHLKVRLALPGISYIDLISHRQYSHDDFCSFGSRFFDFIHESTFFTLEQTTEFTWINHQYGSLFPKDVMEFRQELINLKLSLSENASLPQTCPVDYPMITYPQVNHKTLYKTLCSKNTFQEQIKYFLSRYEMPAETCQNKKRFVSLLNDILKQKFDNRYIPVLHTFGSFSNGLGTYNSDLDIFIEFKGIVSDVLDFGTSLMALEVILEIMKQEMMVNVKSDMCIIQSRRCPIIKLSFNKCFSKVYIPKGVKGHFQFGKCDISLNQIYGVYNSKILHLLTNYDRRFYEMSMVLKFWAKCNGIIGSQTFSTYAFTMLIIYYLQQLQPPVLPTFEKLCQVATKKIKIHKWEFPIIDDINLLPPNRSTMDTLSLIQGFFTFYSEFQCYSYAIRPRTGQFQTKFSLAIEKEAYGLDNFNTCSYFCIEDPFVLDHNVGYNFRQKFVPKLYDVFFTMASLTRTNGCMLKLTSNEPLPMTVNRNFLMLPNNLFRYEWEWSSTSITVKPFKTETIDIDKLCYGFRVYFLFVLRRFFNHYVNIADSHWGLNLIENRIQVTVNYRCLEVITKSLAFDTLIKFLQCKANTSIPVLKRFRQQLLHEKRDILQRMNAMPKSTDCLPWFEMEVCKTSYGFAYFTFQPMMANTVQFYKKADLILEAIFILLQHILITIDRANAQESFDLQMQLYFSD